MLATSPSSLSHLRGRHYVSDQEFSRADLEALIELASRLKALRARRRFAPFLPGRHLAMIFEAASTRTRVSFENGFAELGGNALYLRPGEIHLPGRETIGDTAQTLSRLCDAIVIRAKKAETIVELARYATVPVINGMDDVSHPVQSMSDMLTIFEHAGALAGVRLAFVGDVLFAGAVGRSDFPGGDGPALLRAIRERLFPLGDDVRFVPGHGPMSTFGAERRDNPYVGERAA